MLQIRCKNNNTTRSFPEGSTLLEILKGFPELEFNYPVVSAKVNNASQGLRYKVWQNRDVEFIELSDPSGMRAYTRSLCFVLYKAASDLFPECRLYVEHSISGGFYCNFYTEGANRASIEDVAKIRARMQEIIDADMPFRHNEAPTEEAVHIFRERGFLDKVKLLETSDRIYCDYYTLGDTVDYYYGALLP
ncbi:MAG: nucleoside kinase, partial [Bacteroidales bacterium]|nr:nucleoside kinase [Bacteroidales bacterium]